MALDLNNSKILEAIKWHVDRTVNFDLSYEARQIVERMPKFLAGTPVEQPDMQIVYQNCLVRARLIALPLLDEGEITQLIQSKFVDIFSLPDYDIWQKLKIKLIAIPQFTDRDILKKKVRDALLLNDQILTKENLIQDGKSVRGTLKNWLTDYHRTAGGAGEVTVLQLSQYLINSPNTKKISDESRRKLEYLLEFYEKLKVSSVKFQGVEESIIFNDKGVLEIFEEGKAERIGREIKDVVKQLESAEMASEIKAELEARYRGNKEEREMIEAEKAKIIKTTGGSPKKLFDLLAKTIDVTSGRKIQKVKAKAVLAVLAEQGAIEEILEDRRFNKMMVRYFKEKGRAADLDGFKVNPRAPQYLGDFLQHILKDKIGLSEDESARVGMQIFNLLMKKGADSEYRRLVYFDLEKKEFKWS